VLAWIYEHGLNETTMFKNPHHIKCYSRFSGFDPHDWITLWRPPSSCLLHPKLCSINLYNVTPSPISRNPRERMFVVQISLLIVTFPFLISQNLSLMQTTEKANPHPCIAPCVNMWSVTFLLFFLSFSFLCHTAEEGQVEWTTPHHQNVALCVIP
jgi:hypothetical protein